MRKILILALMVVIALTMLFQSASASDTDEEDRSTSGWYATAKLGTQGFGIARCSSNMGACSTSAGCTQFRYPMNQGARCTATPAQGHKFLFWSINGNYVGQEPERFISMKGTDVHLIEAHFASDN